MSFQRSCVKFKFTRLGARYAKLPPASIAKLAAFAFSNSANFFLSSHDTQRADHTDTLSNTASTPYSAAKRAVTTSNCNTPTAPKIKSAPECGLNTCTAPSSPSCCKPFCNCFIFKGFLIRTLRNNSGAKNGMPVNESCSPSEKLSPI